LGSLKTNKLRSSTWNKYGAPTIARRAL